MMISVSLSVVVIILMLINVGLEHLFIMWYKNIIKFSEESDIKSIKVGLSIAYFFRWVVVYKLIDDFIFPIS
jgi:hypothetical protein